MVTAIAVLTLILSTAHRSKHVTRRFCKGRIKRRSIALVSHRHQTVTSNCTLKSTGYRYGMPQ
jgi:hypothetical protein